jgi:hypothetical protein
MQQNIVSFIKNDLLWCNKTAWSIEKDLWCIVVSFVSVTCSKVVAGCCGLVFLLNGAHEATGKDDGKNLQHNTQSLHLHNDPRIKTGVTFASKPE